MDEDFAASLAIIADSQRRMADTTRSLDANLQFLGRLHAYALAMLLVSLVVSVVGIAGLLWFLAAHHQESKAVQEMVLHNTQTIDAQTRALLEGRQSR
jgi:uncharacterized membrane protein YqhA